MTLPVVASVVGALIVGRLSRRRRDPAPFLATVSHELRTPLHAIAGWVSLLKSGRLSEDETMRALDGIERNVRLEARLIDELLEASRLLSDRVTIALAPLDLRVPIEGAVARVASAAQTKNITLHVNLPESGVTVPGDERRLSDAVCHLLSNAIKFTPTDGAVAVSLTQGGGMYTLVVADTGIGIPPAFLPHVFDRFRQADGSMTREHGGLGLGLAIVKELVELHGGSVRAESAGPGRGARFIVRLPAPAGFHAELPPRGPDAGARLDGIAVLAVDDNADALEVLATALAGHGARVRTALGGEEAIAAWAREPADVLVCDLAMPAVTGFDVLRAVRAQDAVRGRVTPAIAVSAHASEGHQVEALRAGFAAYVAKPFEAPELVRAIAGALGKAV